MTPAAPPARESRQKQYEARKAITKSDIAPLPAIVDNDRRESCRHSLRLFLETYFAEAFPLAWSPAHLAVIDSIERQIKEGGSVAIAMPRGSGKTTLIIRAAIWAVLYGHAEYVMIVAADATKAKNLLDTIKKSFWFNQRLYEDFPEVCHPIRSLNGLAINARKQHINGDLTLIDWRDSVAVLPTVRGSESSGARIDVMGVTAAGRGAQHTLPDGRVIRPQLVLIDDFQTRESAGSVTQCDTRLRIIAGDLAGMKGPDDKMAMLAAITIIYPDDAADQLIDREKNPEWRGQRYQMVDEWPENETLWEQYAELLLRAKRDEVEPVEANQFYLDNREEMDRGHRVSWPERKEGDISAIQHAYNLKLRIGEEAFNAEYQNTPDAMDAAALDYLSAVEIAGKINGRAQGKIGGATETVVAAIDVQSTHLWWAVMAFEGGFNGTLLDYGTWPSQGSRRFYTKAKMPRTFDTDERYKGKTEEGQIHAAIRDLLEHLGGLSWPDDNNTEHQVSRILVDEGYQAEVVHAAIKSSPLSRLTLPAKGMGIKASSLPMSEFARRKGEPSPRHNHWRIRLSRGSKRSLRTMLWDTNYWQAFVHNRLLVEMGASGCLAWWGDNPLRHRLLAAHIDSKVAHLKEHGSRQVVEFTNKPAGPDEDLFDCVSMCHAAASEQGVALQDAASSRKQGYAPQEGRLTLNEYLKKKKKHTK